MILMAEVTITALQTRHKLSLHRLPIISLQRAV